MSERDRKHYAAIKSDPTKYAEYLERKRRERAARPEYETERKRKWRAANPSNVRRIRDAGHAVERAVKGRKLYKRKSCEKCHVIGKVEAHHYRGYEKEHWLDVQWLCKNCHAKAHRPE